MQSIPMKLIDSALCKPNRTKANAAKPIKLIRIAYDSEFRCSLMGKKGKKENSTQNHI